MKQKPKSGLMKLKHGASMKPNGDMQLNGVIIMIWNLRF